MNTAIIMDMMFNTEMIVKDMKGGKEDMTEKRFKMKKLEYEAYFIDSQQEYVDEDEPNFKIDGERTLSDSQILDLLNENEQLKKENKELKMDKDSLATGFDEYQVQVAETLQKHYNQTLNTHIARFVKLLADELGIDLQ